MKKIAIHYGRTFLFFIIVYSIFIHFDFFLSFFSEQVDKPETFDYLLVLKKAISLTLIVGTLILLWDNRRRIIKKQKGEH